MQCPKCKKDIDHFIAVIKEFGCYKATLKEFGIEYKWKDNLAVPDSIVFRCPECNSNITEDEEVALSLLKGRVQ